MFAGSRTHAVSFLRLIAIDIYLILLKQRSNNGIRKQISLEDLFGKFMFI